MWGWDTRDNVWSLRFRVITSELFDLRFIHHFLPNAPAARPLLLLLDGHSLHYNPSVISKAAEEKVIIFCLPSHSSHETQPLNKGQFGPLKPLGKRCVRSFWWQSWEGCHKVHVFQIVWWSMDAFNDLKNIQAGFNVLESTPWRGIWSFHWWRKQLLVLLHRALGQSSYHCIALYSNNADLLFLNSHRKKSCVFREDLKKVII